MGNESSYLFTTTRHLTAAYLDAIKGSMEEGEYLVIACRSYGKGLDRAYTNIEETVTSVNLRKGVNLKAALGSVHAMYPTCSDFEREFIFPYHWRRQDQIDGCVYRLSVHSAQHQKFLCNGTQHDPL